MNIKFLIFKEDGDYPSMLYAVLNKSWKQHPTKQQLNGHLFHKPSNKNEQDIQGTSRKVRMNSEVTYSHRLR